MIRVLRLAKIVESENKTVVKMAGSMSSKIVPRPSLGALFASFKAKSMFCQPALSSL